ncbi:MAG: YbbR-like domain-containing protein [Nitrospiraceae bacterium]|jgi:YbbR domain-containing protein|nr:YbbR-like domain-containing protein [Nitrospiraceae bacterium]
MIIPQKIRQFFSTNLLLKALSLFLAILLWFYISQRGQESFTMNVPIIVNHIPSSVELERASPTHVLVTFTAPPGLYQQLKDQDLSVRIRADSIPTGTRRVLISPSMITLPPGIHIQRITPKLVSLHLVRTIIRILPVELEYYGQLTVPLDRFRITVSPDTIKVQGDAAILNKMRSLRIPPIDLKKITRRHSEQFVIPLTTREGSGYQILEPEKVTVTIIPIQHR